MLSIKYHGNKNAPTLVLLHGMLGSGEDWQPFIHQWSANFYCATIDLPGHGNSLIGDKNKVYTFTDVADMIVREIEAQSFYLIGYSMGGRIALDIIKRYKQRIIKAICISASPGIEDKKEAQQRYNRDQKLLKGKDQKQFLQQWYKQPLFIGIPEHKNYEQLLTKRLQGNFVEMQKGLNIMSVGKQPNMWPWLCINKPQPLLYVCGELDKKYTAIAQRLKQNIHVQVFTLKNSSHMPHFQQPKVFSDIVNNYFQLLKQK
ncbi:2-succinyl-6-hydroxy-2,4-cyclohexadiene-1-carboxylate synthase [Candidatus Uabimicrobium sp. HlEnr_7]|uniref:2-succinyl-6-hydroxy-2, 4-cyclohexadiene-1-carboxylate synthase n=1 Tax=Candidatus Uabimicrobium helgolandensis TaxID=3095367 RepID=UPI0035577724